MTKKEEDIVKEEILKIEDRQINLENKVELLEDTLMSVITQFKRLVAELEGKYEK